MKTKHEEFWIINKMLHLFEHALVYEELTPTRISKFQKKLDELAGKFQYDESLGDERAKLYELQALIYVSEGKFAKARILLLEAQSITQPQVQFVTETARALKPALQPKPAKKSGIRPKQKRYNGNLEGWLALYALRIFLIPAYALYDLVSNSSIDLSHLNPETHSAFQQYIGWAVFINVVTITGAIVLGYLFFTKHRYTRVSALALEAIIIVPGFVFGSVLESIINQAGVDAAQATDITGPLYTSAFLGIAWFMYWLLSRRAKETFTH